MSINALVFLLLVSGIAGLTIYHTRLPYGWFLSLRTFLLLSAIYFASNCFALGVVRNPKLKSIKARIFTSLFSTLLCLLLLEVVFTFLPRSHGVGFAYAARNWHFYYLEDNKQGFRDEPWNHKNLDQPILLFLGDSFTAGMGIKNPEDRFANLLGDRLKADYEMVVCAKGGFSTRDQLEALQNLNLSPAAIVFQYYGNDIEGDALIHGKTRKTIRGYEDLSTFESLAVRSSYLLNYLYWTFPRSYLNDYAQFLTTAYQDEKIFASHLQSVQEIKAFCIEKNIPLYSIMIPFLQDLERSTKLYEPAIAKILDDPVQECYLIPLQASLSRITAKQRIVNRNDAHASKQVHQIIAREILPFIKPGE